MKFLKIGIRYCGGCNSSYDRKKLVSSLIEELDSSFNIEIAKEIEIYELIILVCGCANCCVSHEKYNSKKGKIFINNVRNYERLLEDIKRANL